MNKEQEQPKTEYELYLDLKRAQFNLQALKPIERSEKSRCYAVALTKLEKLLAYYFMNVVPDEQK